MAKIKNLMFDLGGVLLNIDYNKTADAFKKLGVLNFDDLYSQHEANHLFESLETGKISEEVFYSTMQQYCETGTNVQQIQTAWNAMLLDFRVDSLKFLDGLKEKYNLFLLSNTNIIHHTAFTKLLQQKTGQQSLDSYFIKTYFSHEIFIRKPYPGTYKIVVEDAKINAEETLFIDDSINNIEGAKGAGLQVYHLLAGEKIENIEFQKN
ncbi:MAG: HAD family phosphatase [Ferruginibacter sp.]|nr:HAD family phosphatase [Ferruginibacter sp.]